MSAILKEKIDGADISSMTERALNINDLHLEATVFPKVGALAKCKGLWYNKVDDDPIEAPQSVGASIGADEKLEIQNAFR